MANASVEKLKALGIRHGEKAVVGLTVAALVACTVVAIARPALDMKAEVLKSKADGAEANLRKQQDPKDILAKLEREGLKDPNFQQIVANQIANALKPDDYRSKLDWVTPEPGAGLIRDQPELIAPTELAAFPGRGGLKLFVLDEKGERVPDLGDPKKKGARNGPGMAMGGMPGMGPGPGGPPANESPEAKKRREAEEKKRLEAFAGKVEPDEKKAEAAPQGPQGPFKEEVRGKRWIVITGVIDNEKLKKNYLMALKNAAVAYPNYKRIDVEYRTLQSDGTWTEWTENDKAKKDKKWEILDNLPELDTEYVPPTQRPEALVDPLPFLTAGYWSGVHVARLVPAAIRDTPKAGPAGGPGGMPMGGPGAMGMGMGMQGGGMQGGGGRPQGGNMQPPGMAMGGGMGMPMGGKGMMGGAMQGGGGDAEEMNFTKHEDPSLMLRSLDFAVEPNTSYQFRVRIVVFNPNKDRTDVNPGVDTESNNLVGPWSAATDVVTVPADVTAYAMAPEPVARRDDLVSFQVFKWDSGTGHTVQRTDISGPGEIIGEYDRVQMPSSEGGGAKSVQIDFNSRAVVLDTFGGKEKLPDFGVERNPFDVPAMAMLIEPDGSVVIRSQGNDKTDEVRKDMDNNYRQAIEDSGKKREAGDSRMPGAGGKKKKKKKGGR